MAAPTKRTSTPGVYKRGSRYLAVVLVGGKQVRRSARTLREARIIKSQLQADTSRNELVVESNMRFEPYALEWIERYSGRNGSLRERTRDDYRRTLVNRVIPYFGKTPLRKIRPANVYDYITWLQDEQRQGCKLADSTIDNAIKPLRACLASATREDLITHNPVIDVVVPRSTSIQNDDDENVRALSREQLAQLLEMVPSRHRLLIEFMASTGLRVSEALAVEWQHLTLDGSRPCVRVRQAWVKNRIVPPKTKRSRRDVPLSYNLVTALQSLHKQTEWPRATDPVFCSQVGTRLSDSNIRNRHLKPALEEVGAPWAAFHTLRHTCASLLFAEGASPVQVQHWLGHHSAHFTLRTYVHLLPGEGHPAFDLGLALQGGNRVTTEPTPPDFIPRDFESANPVLDTTRED